MQKTARSRSHLPSITDLLRFGLQSAVYLVVKLRLLWIILIAFFFLSGCVQYDLGIRFADTNHGEIRQQIHLNQQPTGFSNAIVTTWLENLEQQAQKLGGRSQHPSAQDLILTVPFHNAKDLEAKFDQLLQPKTQNPGLSKPLNSNPPASVSRLRIRSNNLLLWQRSHLIYDLDLRSLKTLMTQGSPLSNPDAPLELKLSLSTPWGGQPIVSETSLAPTTLQKGEQLIWLLKPGEVNHLEAVFWVPSPLGIGAAVIALLVALGMFWESQRSLQPAIDL